MRGTVLIIGSTEPDVQRFKDSLTSKMVDAEIIGYPNANKLSSILKMVNVDCVVLKFMPPEFNGLAYVEQIKNIAPHCGIILFSAVVDELLVSQAFKAGVDDYLPIQQFSDELVAEMLTSVIKKKRKEIELRTANSELELLRAVIDNTPSLIMVCDPETSLFITFNRALNRFLDLPAEQIKSRSYFHVSEQFDSTDDWFRFVEKVKTKGHHVYETILTNANGESIPFEFDCCLAVLANRSYLLFSGMDISRLKQVQTELVELATQDPLTKLRNRRGLSDEYARLVKSAVRDKGLICLAIFDLDNFKRVNDNLGHDVGDEVLKQFAKLLKRIAKRPLDLIVRAGGEEFLLLMINGSPESLKTIMNKIIVETPKVTSPSVTVSGGAVCLSNEDTDIKYDQAFKIADERLYQAKTTGKNKLIFGMVED